MKLFDIVLSDWVIRYKEGRGNKYINTVSKDVICVKMDQDALKRDPFYVNRAMRGLPLTPTQKKNATAVSVVFKKKIGTAYR